MHEKDTCSRRTEYSKVNAFKITTGSSTLNSGFATERFSWILTEICAGQVEALPSSLHSAEKCYVNSVRWFVLYGDMISAGREKSIRSVCPGWAITSRDSARA